MTVRNGSDAAGGANTSVATTRLLLKGLSGVLATVSRRLDTQGNTAEGVALLVAQAEALAERARALATLPYPAGGTFSSLTTEVNAFAGHAAAVAAQAEQEAGESRTIAASIRQQLVGLHELGRQAEAETDREALRGPLEGILGALTPLSGRLQAVATLAAEVSGLGERAADMSERGAQMQGAARAGGAAALTLFRELRSFADAASTASETMLAENYGIRQVMTAMRDRAQQIQSDPGAMRARASASGAGFLPARHQVAEPERTEALRGMVWKPRLFGRRPPG